MTGKHRCEPSLWVPAAWARLAAITLTVASCTTLATGSTWYVAPGAGGLGNAWASPTNLQFALLNAVTGDDIYLLQGTYAAPAQGFLIDRQLQLYGGFAGWESTPTQRNGGPSILDGGGSSKHVVRLVIANLPSGTPALLDRFHIRGGNASGAAPDDVGGGVYVKGSDVYLIDCFIHSNSALNKGGGIFVDGHLDTLLGGTILNLKRCELTDNIAANGTGTAIGGGIYAKWVVAQVASTAFGTNSAEFRGGGAFIEDLPANTSFKFDDCDFWANTVTSSGGAICLGTGGSGLSSTYIYSCSFSDNYSTTNQAGRAIYCDTSGTFLTYANIRNSIVWYSYNSPLNTQPPIFGNTTVNWSDVETPPHGFAVWPGTGNILADPLFANHGTGRLRIQATSPCIDVGSSANMGPDGLDLDSDGNTTEPTPLDIEGNARVNGGQVDMGAHER